MTKNYFKVLRGGTHTSFQDSGYINKQHLGITSGGVVDSDLYELSNKILNNHKDTPVLEFSIQGPSLKLSSNNCRVVICGNVYFTITKLNKTFKGRPNQSYLLYKGDIIDILSTLNSNYGYMSIEGGFDLQKEFGSFSTLTISNIGSNNGKKISINQKIYIKKNGSNINSSINFEKGDDDNSSIIRVVRGPQMNYFFQKTIKKFFNSQFKISNSSNRMGIRLTNNICKAAKSHNIDSEGITKGSIQIPGDGNPIVLINDHPTIGGYPKIAIVILSDLSKISQLPIGSAFNFKEVSIKEAENLFYNKIKKNNNFFKKIKNSKIK